MMPFSSVFKYSPLSMLVYTTCSSFLSYFSQAWLIFFFFYFESVNELCSGWLEVMASFKRSSFSIYSTPGCSFTRSPTTFFIFTTLISLTKLSWFQHSTRPVIQQAIKQKTCLCTSIRTFIILESIRFCACGTHALTRDVLKLILLMIFNFMLIVSFKRWANIKKRLTVGQSERQDYSTTLEWAPSNVQHEVIVSI